MKHPSITIIVAVDVDAAWLLATVIALLVAGAPPPVLALAGIWIKHVC